MARNTQVAADPPPPVTQTLAQLVASHPSRGWSDAVDLEAHRTQMNWVGCAVGAASHETAQAALAAVQLLQPAPQASVLGRSERVDMASAALINGISSQETRLTNASFITKSSRFFANAGCRQGPGMLMSKCHLHTLLIPPRGAAATPPGGAHKKQKGHRHPSVRSP